MKKFGLWTLCLIMLVTMMACGETEKPTEITENTLIVSKDGGVTAVSVDVFDRDYYSVDSLQEMATNEADAYNQVAGAGKVSFDKIETADNNVVKIYMNYADYTSYADFNDMTLFVGTITEAYNAGIDLDVTLSSINNAEKTIGKDDILGMGSSHIMVLSETSYVELPGEVTYVSAGVSKTSKAKEVSANFDQDLIYIIYK